MSDKDDLASPSKKPRMEIMTTAASSSKSPDTTNVTTSDVTVTTTPPPPPLPPRSAATTQSCFSKESTTTTCLETAQKDSIIAQILAGTEGAEFGEPSFCPPGVFFDDSCFASTSGGGDSTPVCVGSHSSWTREPGHQSLVMSGSVAKETRSLLICMESRSCSLQHNIEQVVTDHELITCTASEALHLCNEHPFQLIWLQLPCPPSEDILAVITGIRYSSKLNRKTIQLGVTVTQPEIDLNLHGIDEILLEPVSRSIIRQKYFDWTSVKLIPDYELNLRDTPMSPTTPESSVSTESTIELSLSSLASDTTNDSGIQGEMDVSDLKPSTAFLFPQQQGCLASTSKAPRIKHSNGRPSTPPSWCRVEHATKEKHRRERIKDSCDQLRVLLPYVRGRKTDMASILEMTVDYLKIVNSNLPHEFHAHVLDVMTKGGNSPPTRPARTHVTCGRGSRGGRGRGAAKRSTGTPSSPSHSPSPSPSPSPSRPVVMQDHCGSQTRMGTHSLSRGVMSSPVSVISRAAGSNEGSRGSKLSKRSGQQSLVLSPGSQGLPGIYVMDGKDRGVVRQDSVITNTMTLPTFLPSSHYSAASSHLFSDHAPSPGGPSSSSSSSATTLPAGHTFPPPPPGLMSSLSSSSSSPSGVDCGLPVPRLYASAHLTVDPGFLSHPGHPPALAPRYHSLHGGEREGGAGLSFAGEPPGGPHPPPPPPPPPPTAYFHYYSNMPDIGPAYTMAGGGGGGGVGVGGCGGLGVPICCGGGGGEFMASGSLHPLTSANSSSAFTPPPPPRLQLGAPPTRGGGGGGTKVELTPQSAGILEPSSSAGDTAVYTLMETSSKISK
ncbi:uncharacterized protein LOC143289520 isoform X2 [Babylonia areolata]|uniref:uncharacterized protein LOC143289520 isoform X2 n=1 Tax=Babylonia areolata TaxID=304850 RepID=UPI003FD69615